MSQLELLPASQPSEAEAELVRRSWRGLLLERVLAHVEQVSAEAWDDFELPFTAEIAAAMRVEFGVAAAALKELARRGLISGDRQRGGDYDPPNGVTTWWRPRRPAGRARSRRKGRLPLRLDEGEDTP